MVVLITLPNIWDDICCQTYTMSNYQIRELIKEFAKLYRLITFKWEGNKPVYVLPLYKNPYISKRRKPPTKIIKAIFRARFANGHFLCLKLLSLVKR